MVLRDKLIVSWVENTIFGNTLCSSGTNNIFFHFIYNSEKINIFLSYFDSQWVYVQWNFKKCTYRFFGPQVREEFNDLVEVESEE